MLLSALHDVPLEQVSTAHGTLSPLYEPLPEEQSACVVIVHAVALQQAPVGVAGQVLALHKVLSPLYAPPPDAQPACVLTVQIVPLQQAPVAGQTPNPHAWPSPMYCPVHAAWVVTAQSAPTTQHAPFGVQVTPLQAAAAVKDSPGPRQLPCSAFSSHAPSRRQQAPSAHGVPSQFVPFPR